MSEKNPEKDKLNNEPSSLSIPEIKGSALTSLMHMGPGLESPFMKDIYLRKQAIVGTRFLGGSDELVEDLEVGSRITFLREPDNAFDSNAIMALDDQGRKLGYIPRRENELIGALMAAGKYFYGIITEKPEGDYYGNRTPGSIWMDLYMREFALPDDLSEIPLQGYKGSFAVLDLIFADREDTDYPDKGKEESHKRRYLSAVYAIKVIHGEEKSSFRLTFAHDIRSDGTSILEDAGEETKGPLPLSDMDRTADHMDRTSDHMDHTSDYMDYTSDYMDYTSDYMDSTSDSMDHTSDYMDRTSDYEQLITDLDHFLGHLPLVVHDISEEDLSALREDYGMILGKPLSNHIIDTRQMAGNHIPFIRDYSIYGLADHLDIHIELDDPLEESCRIIWQLYQRMERSELEKKTESQGVAPAAGQVTEVSALGVEIAKSNGTSKESLDKPLIDIPLTEAARRILLYNGIDTLRELSRRSAVEVRDLSYMDEHVLEEIETLLSGMSLHFRPENEDSFLYGYPEYIHKTIEEKKDYWEQVLFFEVLAVNFTWLEQFSSLRSREPLPKISDRAYKAFDNIRDFKHFLTREQGTILGFASDMKDVMDVHLPEAIGQPEEDGDPHRIALAAEDLIKIYKSVVHWMEELRLIETDSEIREGMDDYIGYGEDICKSFDEFHQQAIDFIRMMKKYYDGEIDIEDIPNNITLTISLEDGRSEKILDLLREEVKRGTGVRE